MRPISFHSSIRRIIQPLHTLSLFILGAVVLLICGPYIVVGWIQDKLREKG